MAKLILKMPYIKKGKTSHKNYLVKYISTRSGVQKTLSLNEEVTDAQKELIKKIIKDFPSTKELHEYEDLKSEMTKENASEFIQMALESNVHQLDVRENYIGYIANRPNSVKVSSHGLFSMGEEEICLTKVAKEIANHNGNVWTPIISLKREDAVKMGYDNAESWKMLLERQAMNIADALKIDHKDFVYYAAFHDEGHHPHIHMVCYNVDDKEGYLNKNGIEKMKSILQNDIFKEQLVPLYAKKSKARDELKSEAKKVFKLINDNAQDFKSERFNILVNQLKIELQNGRVKFA